MITDKNRDEYFNLCYTHRIHEFSKIDDFKELYPGAAKKTYKTLKEFYIEELDVSSEVFMEIKKEFELYKASIRGLRDRQSCIRVYEAKGEEELFVLGRESSNEESNVSN